MLCAHAGTSCPGPPTELAPPAHGHCALRLPDSIRPTTPRRRATASTGGPSATRNAGERELLRTRERHSRGPPPGPASPPRQGCPLGRAQEPSHQGGFPPEGRGLRGRQHGAPPRPGRAAPGCQAESVPAGGRDREGPAPLGGAGPPNSPYFADRPARPGVEGQAGDCRQTQKRTDPQLSRPENEQKRLPPALPRWQLTRRSASHGDFEGTC